MFNEKAFLAQFLTGSDIPAIARGGSFGLRFFKQIIIPGSEMAVCCTIISKDNHSGSSDVPLNCQTACDPHLKAGPLPGDRAPASHRSVPYFV
jgi:hypothetical protein